MPDLPLQHIFQHLLGNPIGRSMPDRPFHAGRLWMDPGSADLAVLSIAYQPSRHGGRYFGFVYLMDPRFSETWPATLCLPRATCRPPYAYVGILGQAYQADFATCIKCGNARCVEIRGGCKNTHQVSMHIPTALAVSVKCGGWIGMVGNGWG